MAVRPGAAPTTLQLADVRWISNGDAHFLAEEWAPPTEKEPTGKQISTVGMNQIPAGRLYDNATGKLLDTPAGLSLTVAAAQSAILSCWPSQPPDVVPDGLSWRSDGTIEVRAHADAALLYGVLQPSSVALTDAEKNTIATAPELRQAVDKLAAMVLAELSQLEATGALPIYRVGAP